VITLTNARSSLWERFLSTVPRGRGLSDESWYRRHRAVLALLAIMIAGMPWFGRWTGFPVWETSVRAIPTIVFGLGAIPWRGRRRWQPALATFGLMSASYTYLFLSRQLMEVQLLFFLSLVLVAMYQEWLPFVLAAVSIPLHVLVMAFVTPGAEYRHSAVLSGAMSGGLVQLIFVVLIAAITLATWSASEVQLLRDPVTRLANRRLLCERIEIALAWPGQSAVLFVNLAGFGRITESYGHEAGDCVLREVANRLAFGVRLQDQVARVGDGQFAVLMIEATEEMALRMAGHLTGLLSEVVCIDCIEGLELHVTPNVGIATSGPDGGSSGALLRAAALAAEAAQDDHDVRGSRQRFVPSMADAAVARLAAEIDLRAAVERGEFVLYYQPIVTIADGRLHGFEALVRWQSPTRGLVPPAEFIPLAEETGLIELIGAWVLREATEQVARWGTAGWHDGLSMSVNMAAAQLSAPGVVGQVRTALTRSGMRPGGLILEITESALVDRAAPAVLAQLKELGVRLALDDFGTGYSSLSYLARLPINIIKVDKSFIDDVPDGPNAAVTDAVMAMAHALNVQTVAEGIEHLHQVAELHAMGCDLGQGYLFNRPLPAAQAEAMLMFDAERAFFRSPADVR